MHGETVKYEYICFHTQPSFLEFKKKTYLFLFIRISPLGLHASNSETIYLQGIWQNILDQLRDR